jgi:hypothetical protein
VCNWYAIGEEWMMARSIPTVREGSLQEHIQEDNSTDTISIGTAAWYTWLEQHRSFTLETPRTTFTARKEQRTGAGTGMPTGAFGASYTASTSASQQT